MLINNLLIKGEIKLIFLSSLHIFYGYSIPTSFVLYLFTDAKGQNTWSHEYADTTYSSPYHVISHGFHNLFLIQDQNSK